MTETMNDETAWERWDDLGDRLERAVSSLSTMAQDAGTQDQRDRLQAKADAVQSAYKQWAEVSKHGGENAPRPAQSMLWFRLTEAKEKARSTGERSGYDLALDYMRSL